MTDTTQTTGAILAHEYRTNLILREKLDRDWAEYDEAPELDIARETAFEKRWSELNEQTEILELQIAQCAEPTLSDTDLKLAVMARIITELCNNDEIPPKAGEILSKAVHQAHANLHSIIGKGLTG